MTLECTEGPLDAEWRREWLSLSPSALRERLASAVGGIDSMRSCHLRWLAHAVRAYESRASPSTVRALAVLAGGGELTEAVQDAMASAVARPNDDVKDPRYSEAVVRCLLACANTGETVSDALAEAMVACSTAGSVDSLDPDALEPWSCRVVSFWDVSSGAESARYAIRQRQGLRQVGLLPWAAGIKLAEYILSTPEAVRGRRVVELGAGVGITACCVAVGAHVSTSDDEPGAASFVATDIGYEVLENLRWNLVENGSAGPASVTVDAGKLELPPTGTTCPCFVAGLEWHADLEPGPLLAHTDMVLAADCLYDPKDVPGLVSTLHRLLSGFEAGKRPAEALVATTQRQEATLGLFLQCASDAGLAVTEVEDPWAGCTHKVFDYSVSPVQDIVLLHRLSLPP